MTGTELTTLIIAAYGAALSTGLGIQTFVRGTRRIAVSCRPALAVLETGGTWEHVVIQAVNKRNRPVTITEAGLQMSNKHFFTQLISKVGAKPLPAKLDLGDLVEIYFDLSALKKTIAECPPGVKLTRAFVRDAEGKEYTSRLPKALKDLS